MLPEQRLIGLYEAFGSNPYQYGDPMGLDIILNSGRSIPSSNLPDVGELVVVIIKAPIDLFAKGLNNVIEGFEESEHFAPSTRIPEGVVQMGLASSEITGGAKLIVVIGKAGVKKAIIRSSEKAGAKKAIIRSPENVSSFSSSVKLNRHQKELLEKLQKSGDQIELPKKMLRMGDMIKLSKKEGVEFAMFTKGGKRILIRGERTFVPFTAGQGKKWAKRGWKWSGHTHPHSGYVKIKPSVGMKADTGVLWRFHQYGKKKQTQSVIYDWDGNYYVFKYNHGGFAPPWPKGN